MGPGAEILRMHQRTSHVGRYVIWIAVWWEFPTTVSLTYCVFTSSQDAWGQIAYMGLRDYNSLGVLFSWCLVHFAIFARLQYQGSGADRGGSKVMPDEVDEASLDLSLSSVSCMPLVHSLGTMDTTAQGDGDADIEFQADLLCWSALAYDILLVPTLAATCSILHTAFHASSWSGDGPKELSIALAAMLILLVLYGTSQYLLTKNLARLRHDLFFDIAFLVLKVLLCLAVAVLRSASQDNQYRQSMQVILVIFVSVLLIFNVYSQPCSEKGGLSMNAYRSGTFTGILLMALCAYVQNQEESTMSMTVYLCVVLPVVACVIHLAKESEFCMSRAHSRESLEVNHVLDFAKEGKVAGALIDEYVKSKFPFVRFVPIVASKMSEGWKLQRLNLRQQNITAIELTLLVKSFPATITSFNLACNRIGCDGATALSSLVSCAMHLEVLDVSFNQIRLDGATALAKGIQSRNTGSRFELDLSGNHIGDALGLFGVCTKSGRLQLLRADFTHVTWTGGDDSLYGICDGLETLALANNNISDEGCISMAANMTSASASSLQMLALQSNCIGAPGILQLALALGRTPTLQHLDLSHNPIGDEGALALAEALGKNETSLTDLNLSGCFLGRNVARDFAAAISRNKSLVRLDLSSNQLCNHGLSYDCFSNLCMAVQLSTSPVRNLVLSRNQIRTQGCWPISSMLRSSQCLLQRLDLSCNEITSMGATAIAKALITNKTLLELSLKSNMVDTTAAKAFGEALESNTGLIFLDLENNDVDESGFEALAAGLTKNSTLRVLSMIMNEFDARRGQDVLASLEGAAADGGPIHASVMFRNSDRLGLRRSLRG